MKVEMLKYNIVTLKYLKTTVTLKYERAWKSLEQGISQFIKSAVSITQNKYLHAISYFSITL